MVDRFQQAALAILFAWVPLVFFTPAADGFTLAKEIPAMAALAFLVGLALQRGGKSLWGAGLVKWAVLFSAWMLAVSLAVAPLKMEVLKGSVHLFLMVGALIAVAYACFRGYSYERLWHYALLSGAILAVYGLFQSLGWDKTSWTTGFEGRAFSTLGNPDYLGGHLAGLLPMALILCLRSATFRGRMGWGIVASVMFLGLFATRARGSELALAVSLLFLVLALLSPWGRELAKRNLRFLLVCLAITVAAGAFFMARQGGLSSFRFSQASFQQRWETYRVSWEMIKAHPWLGIGLGQVANQYPIYQFRPYQPEETPKHPYTITEHIHQEFLRFWAEGGLPGLLFFLCLLGAFGVALVRTVRNPKTPKSHRENLIGVAGGVAALLVQSLSNFPFQIAPTVLVFGMCLAGPLALGPAEEKNRPHGAEWKAFPVVPVVLAFLAVVAGEQAMASSIATRNTLGETKLGNPVKAVYFGKRLTQLSAWNPKAWTAYAGALQLAGEKAPALEAYQKSLSLDPFHTPNWVKAAELESDAGRFDRAVSFCEKAESLSPNYAYAYWVEAFCLFKLRRFEQAVDRFKRALDFSPDHAAAYLNMGICYHKMGRKAEAIDAWKKAHALNPADPQAVEYLRANGIVF